MRFIQTSAGMAQIPDSWKGPLYPVIDGDPKTGIFTPIIDRLSEWSAAKLDALIAALNANSPEIITAGVILCAFGVMVSPMIDNNASKWYGRLFTVLWLGVVWRVMI